ncbi:hypothetical protein OSB04_020088 [Centaurea solstitialis]|uniref:Uncharacterized protein n=1 Tax=Centaurea solstitialis TaxID=347529 RepID=A0AA38SRJ6_9ASTR|nr:hypothetical protein OSB04_020088 [Centaurea solstitialis]
MVLDEQRTLWQFKVKEEMLETHDWHSRASVIISITRGRFCSTLRKSKRENQRLWNDSEMRG